MGLFCKLSPRKSHICNCNLIINIYMNSFRDITESARKIIKIEADTLYNLMESVDHNFSKCAELLSKTTGRVVVTGIGKSAIIGQKIVSTFNSTGTQSIFLHAADAIHGDLGMLRKEDTVICISKSGETPEIRVLLTIIRNFGNTIIAMTSNKDSYLAKNSGYVLCIPIENEAEPNNLAPTASSIAQMAMGDALAGVISQIKGFTPENFARFHPGGTLGKQLHLRVTDIFRNNEKPYVFPDSGIKAVIMEITSKRLGATAVLDTSNKLIGIITDGDLRRMLETTINIDNIRAKDIMSINPKTISEMSMAVSALEKMRNHSITQLVVTDDDNSYLGFIHIHDILKEGII